MLSRKLKHPSQDAAIEDSGLPSSA